MGARVRVEFVRFDTDETLCAWMRADATVAYFVERARALGYIAEMCPIEKVQVFYEDFLATPEDVFGKMGRKMFYVVADEGEPRDGNLYVIGKLVKPEIARGTLREARSDLEGAMTRAIDPCRLRKTRSALIDKPYELWSVLEKWAAHGILIKDVGKWLEDMLLNPDMFVVLNPNEDVPAETLQKMLVPMKSVADSGDPLAQFNYGIHASLDEKMGDVAMRYLKLAADQGVLGAAAIYGDWLRRGECGCVDYAEAARYLKGAGDRGCGQSQVAYGALCRFGMGVDVDLKEAARYFKMAADKGNGNGLCMYGVCLLKGDGVESNQEMGISCLHSAMEEDDSTTFVEKLQFADGDRFREDAELVAPHMMKLADQGEAWAMKICAELASLGLCSRSDQTPQSTHHVGVIRNGGSSVRRVTGFPQVKGAFSELEMLKYAADSGDGKSQTLYGCMLCRRSFLETAEAFKYFELAAHNGEQEGQLLYGLFLYNGVGVSADKVKSVQYIKRCADQGSRLGQWFYGLSLFAGEGVPNDLPEAARYFKLAADSGLCGAQLYYGMCLYHSFGVNTDLSEAARYFRMAALQRSPIAQLYYSLCLYEGFGVERNFNESMRYLQMAANQNYAEAQMAYGSLMRLCNNAFPDSSRWREYLQAAINGNSADAINTYNCLSVMYGENIDVVDISAQFALAGIKGSACGSYNGGVCQLPNIDNEEWQVDFCLASFKRAAEMVDSTEYNHEDVLRQCLGVDKEKRWEYIKREADLGSSFAQFLFGQHKYCSGDLDESLKYFKLAADQKHPEAQYAYGVLQLLVVGAEMHEVEPYYEEAIKGGVLAAQYQWGSFLATSSDLSEKKRAVEHLKMAAETIVKRRSCQSVHFESPENRLNCTLYFSCFPERLSAGRCYDENYKFMKCLVMAALAQWMGTVSVVAEELEHVVC